MNIQPVFITNSLGGATGEVTVDRLRRLGFPAHSGAVTHYPETLTYTEANYLRPELKIGNVTWNGNCTVLWQKRKWWCLIARFRFRSEWWENGKELPTEDSAELAAGSAGRDMMSLLSSMRMPSHQTTELRNGEYVVKVFIPFDALTMTPTEYEQMETEGWALIDVDSSGYLEIERCDDSRVFTRDDDALDFVKLYAQRTAGLHRKCLAIHRWFSESGAYFRPGSTVKPPRRFSTEGLSLLPGLLLRLEQVSGLEPDSVGVSAAVYSDRSGHLKFSVDGDMITTCEREQLFCADVASMHEEMVEAAVSKMNAFIVEHNMWDQLLGPA